MGIPSKKKPFKTSGVILAAAWTALLLTGCGGGEDSSSPASQRVKNSPAQIAQESADNYNENVNGLVTGTTLMRWIDNWEANKPAGINGRLVILQVTNGPDGAEYITPNPAGGVLTYSVPASRWTMNRSNGVTTTRSMVPDGAAMDKFFKDYGIDPTNDMLVCAMGTGNASNAMTQGRCWYAFRYWGVAKEHLAQLNGGAANGGEGVIAARYLGSTATCDEAKSAACLPGSGYVSVRDLPEDNFDLQATMADVIDIAEGRTSAENFLWDARNKPQYLGTGFQNNNSRAGHPHNALLLEHTEMVDAIGRYKSKAELRQYMNGEIPAGGNFQFTTQVGSQAVPVGPGNAYQPGQTVVTYCETTFRAMLTGTVSSMILGLPTRFYDGAMVEWNSMSSFPDKNGQLILPEDSPWRTDLDSRSTFIYSTTTVDPRMIDDPYYDAPLFQKANKILDDDRAYKFGGGSAGGGSGGGASAGGGDPCAGG